MSTHTLSPAAVPAPPHFPPGLVRLFTDLRASVELPDIRALDRYRHAAGLDAAAELDEPALDPIACAVAATFAVEIIRPMGVLS